MASPSVRRRLVFYIHGFDSRSPQPYYELYRDQAALYATRHDAAIDVSELSTAEDGSAEWTIDATVDGTPVQTRYVYLNWSDLVSRQLDKGFWQTLAAGLWTAREALSSLQFANIWRACGSPIALFVYSHIMIVILPLIALALSAPAFYVLTAYAVPNWLAYTAWIALAVILFRLARRTGQNWYVFHLLATINDTLRQARGERPETEQRLDAFAAHVAARSEDDYDEVLLVGHSIGAHQAIAVLARILSRAPRHDARRFSLLTLGQNIPVVSFHPAADGLRNDIAMIAADSRVDWLDVSGPNDWVAFVWLDCTAPPDVPKLPGYRPPLVITNRPFEAFSESTMRSLAYNFFDTHFLYMYANERPTHWDWFKVTAGNQRLLERYGARNPAANAARMGEPGAYRLPRKAASRHASAGRPHVSASHASPIPPRAARSDGRTP